MKLLRNGRLNFLRDIKVACDMCGAEYRLTEEDVICEETFVPVDVKCADCGYKLRIPAWFAKKASRVLSRRHKA